MNHQEFLKKYIGKAINFDWVYDVQCVDWVRFYCKERGFPIKSFWWSAWNGWITWKPFDDTWEKIRKTPFNYPKEWDIVFFNENRCKYWHVAVANKFCNPLVLRYLDENWTWKWDPYTNRFSTYKNCVWWMRRK